MYRRCLAVGWAALAWLTLFGPLGVVQTTAAPPAFCAVPTPPVHAAVVVNEFLPDPSSGNDWVELFNPSDTSISLIGWKIDDKDPGSPKLITAPVIAPNELLVVEVGTMLNKTSDTVRLLDASGAEIDVTDYTSTVQNQSYSRLPDGGPDFALTSSPTRGLPNLPRVRINELVPLVLAANTPWLELYNAGARPVDLSGMLIDDMPGGAPGHLIVPA